MDALSGLLSRFMMSARVFHTGELCGIADFSEDHGVGHLHLVREGRAIVYHPDGPAIEIEVPSILFYPSALSHRLVIPEGSAADVLCATIGFSEGKNSPLAKALPHYLLIPVAEVTSLSPTLGMLFEEAFTDRYGRQAMLDRLCEVLVIQVLRYAVQHDHVGHGMLGGLADPALARALVAIHEQPGQSWTVARLAERAGMSRSGFARHFHSLVGVTPANYLTEWRIAVAQGMLEKRRPVKAVAIEVGYGSQAAFSKAFTQRVGMSPRTWVNQLAEN